MSSSPGIKCAAHRHPPLFKDHHCTVLSPHFLPGPDFFSIMQSSNIQNLCPVYWNTHLTPIQKNHWLNPSPTTIYAITCLPRPFFPLLSAMNGDTKKLAAKLGLIRRFKPSGLFKGKLTSHFPPSGCSCDCSPGAPHFAYTLHFGLVKIPTIDK